MSKQTLHEARIAQNPERALAGSQFRRGLVPRSAHLTTYSTDGDGSAPLGQVLSARSLGSLHYASEVNGRDKCTAFCTCWRGGHW